MRPFLAALVALLLVPSAAAQALDLTFTAGDGSATVDLRAGLDPTATNGIDAALGEAELPPFPPSGVFEARFVAANVPAELGQGSYRDYREGAGTFAGSTVHALQWQLGSGAAAFVLGYDLPSGVSAVVEDFFGGVVLRETLTGSGELRVTNTALTQAKMTVTYTGGAVNSPPAFTSTAVTAGQVGTAYSYAVRATDPDGDALTLTAPTRPPWLTLTDAGGGSATLSGTPTAAGSYAVVLRASDGTAAVDQSFTVTVSARPNGAPAFTSMAVTAGQAGTAYSYAVRATDPDGDALTLTAPTRPPWLTLTDGGSGSATLSGTPTAAGAFDVVLRASDGTATVDQRFTIAVGAAPPPPSGAAVDLVFSVGDGAASQELRAGLDPSATVGLDAALGEEELPPLPPSGVFEARFVGSGVPAELGQGSYRDYRPGGPDFEGSVEHKLQWQLGSGPALSIGYDLPAGVSAVVRDPFGGSVLNETLTGSGTLRVSNAALTQALVTLVYGPTNTAPAFTSTAVTTGQVGTAYSYAVRATDPDGDALTLTAPTRPPWLTLTDGGSGSATLSGTPTAAGAFDVVLRASDGTATVDQSFTVTVSAAPPPPAGAAVDLVFSVGDGAASQELRAGLDPSATVGLDAALGEEELPPLPPSGVFEARFVGSGVPAELGQGSYRDYRPGGPAFEGSVEHKLQWQLGSGPALSIGYDLPAGVSAVVRDPFGGAVLNETLSGSGTLRVTNGALTQALVTLVYGPPNRAPAFTSAPVTAGQVGAPYAYAVTATDADGDALTLAAPTRPSWLTLSDAGGGSATLSGTPTAAGAFDVVLRASDGTATADQRFTITVGAAPVVGVTARVTNGAAPVAGVTVSLTAPAGTQTATTSAAGLVSFSGLPHGETFTLTASLAGASFVPSSFTLPALTRSTEVTFVQSASSGGGSVSVETSAEVGPSGGTIPFAGGGSLAIPAGAVGAATTISVGTFDEVPSGVQPAGLLFYFGPAGVTFSEPLMLTIPYREADVPAGTHEADLRLVRYDERTGTYADVLPATVDTEANVITAQVRTFSGYGAALPQPVDASAGPESGFALSVPVPNPSGVTARVRFALAEAGPARLVLFNALGQEVAVLADGARTAGAHEVTADVSGLAGGVYLLRLEQGGLRTSRMLTVLR